MASKYVEPYLDIINKRYAYDIPVPLEPEQTFLLGNRLADYGLTVAFALLLPVIRGFLRRNVYEPLGNQIMFNSKKTDEKPDPDKIRKWNECSWKLTIYILFTSVAFLISYQEKWFYDTRHFWFGCTSFPPCNLPVSKGVLLFFCLETGFYLQAIHFLAFIEVRRKDWLESMIHHIVTVGLMSYAYYVNFARVGVMVMLCHDISDIFLEAAKLARYAKHQSIAELLFAVFAASWIVCRVIYFPLIIIRSTLAETLQYARRHNIDPEPHYTIFNALLLVLFVLHVYWTYLILKIVYIQVLGGAGKDIREEDDD